MTRLIWQFHPRKGKSNPIFNGTEQVNSSYYIRRDFSLGQGEKWNVADRISTWYFRQRADSGKKTKSSIGQAYSDSAHASLPLLSPVFSSGYWLQHLPMLRYCCRPRSQPKAPGLSSNHIKSQPSAQCPLLSIGYSSWQLLGKECKSRFSSIKNDSKFKTWTTNIPAEWVLFTLKRQLKVLENKIGWLDKAGLCLRGPVHSPGQPLSFWEYGF